MRPLNVLVKYDGISRAGLAAQEDRAAIYNRDGGKCQTCGEPVAWGAFELAHRIANTKANRSKYGSEIIDHRLNRRVTHRGACNSAQNIGNDPGACEALIDEILAEIDKEEGR